MFLLLFLHFTINFLACLLKGRKSDLQPGLSAPSGLTCVKRVDLGFLLLSPIHIFTFLLPAGTAKGKCNEIIRVLHSQSCPTDRDGFALKLSCGLARTSPWWWPDFCVWQSRKFRYERWLRVLTCPWFILTFYRSQNWSSERVSRLPKVTNAVTSRIQAGFQTAEYGFRQNSLCCTYQWMSHCPRLHEI